MNVTLNRDQMDLARETMLARALPRLTHRRWVAIQPGATVALADRDTDTREIVSAMLDICPDLLAQALDALDAHPASEAMTPETQARFTLTRCVFD